MKDDPEEGNELGEDLLQPASWSLEDGECLALTPRTHPVQLCVDSGRVWATIEEDAEDHFLISSAQILLLPVDRLAVFEAWGPVGARGRLCRQHSARSGSESDRTSSQAGTASRGHGQAAPSMLADSLGPAASRRLVTAKHIDSFGADLRAAEAEYAVLPTAQKRSPTLEG